MVLVLLGFDPILVYFLEQTLRDQIFQEQQIMARFLAEREAELKRRREEQQLQQQLLWAILFSE